MEIKNRFVKESDAHYLWSVSGKKLESLDSAGVVPQRVEAFDVSGLCTKGETLAEMLLVQVNALMGRKIYLFLGEAFSLSFSFQFLLVTCFFPFSFSFKKYPYGTEL